MTRIVDAIQALVNSFSLSLKSQSIYFSGVKTMRHQFFTINTSHQNFDN